MEVDWDDLVIETDQTRSFEGQPFSGQAVVRRPDGSIESRVAFEDGFMCGPFSDYYAGGQVECRGNMRYDAYEGEIEYFTVEGILQKSETYERGVCMRRREMMNGVVVAEWSFWDEGGTSRSTKRGSE